MADRPNAFKFGSETLPARNFVQSLLDKAVSSVNSGASQTLTARLSEERPPRDARHLTDTRTRVSTLLEYTLAYEMNKILLEDAKGYSISAVLWNVFPDLIVRGSKRENLLGLEVKALHTAAEEKSANLATPLSLIRKDRDFVVIISWGWQTGEVRGTSITYPHVHTTGCFDAWLLAKIRDYGWLLNQGGRVKGIDLASPIINGSGSRYKAEEGNLGKLMRIQLPREMPTSVPHFEEMKQEDARYFHFKDLVLALGLRETFLELCMLERASDVSVEAPVAYPKECAVLGTAKLETGNVIALVAGDRPDQWLAQNPGSKLKLSACLWLSRKLDWRVYLAGKDKWVRRAGDAKPDSDFEAIQAALRRNA